MLQGTLYNKGRHANYRLALCSSSQGRKNNSHFLQQKANLHMKIHQAVLVRHRPELRSRSPLPETLDSTRLRTGALFAHHKVSQDKSLNWRRVVLHALISFLRKATFKDHIHLNRLALQRRRNNSFSVQLDLRCSSSLPLHFFKCVYNE